MLWIGSSGGGYGRRTTRASGCQRDRPLRCCLPVRNLRIPQQDSSRNVKKYAFLLAALAACAQQRPVVLAPVRMETPTTAGTTPGSVFDTPRDDPFATTNRIDWPGPNRYRSSSGVPGPDYWQQRADYTIAASLDTAAGKLTGAVESRY